MRRSRDRFRVVGFNRGRYDARKKREISMYCDTNRIRTHAVGDDVAIARGARFRSTCTRTRVITRSDRAHTL